MREKGGPGRSARDWSLLEYVKHCGALWSIEHSQSGDVYPN